MDTCAIAAMRILESLRYLLYIRSIGRSFHAYSCVGHRDMIARCLSPLALSVSVTI